MKGKYHKLKNAISRLEKASYKITKVGNSLFSIYYTLGNEPVEELVSANKILQKASLYGRDGEFLRSKSKNFAKKLVKNAESHGRNNERILFSSEDAVIPKHREDIWSYD